jgi:hypothetical protein
MNDKAIFATYIFRSPFSLAARLRSRWRFALKSDRILETLLSVAEPFDNRPGRLYSFVGHKARR